MMAQAAKRWRRFYSSTTTRLRRWHRLFLEDGLEGLTRFDVGGRDGFLSVVQETALKAFVTASPPRNTRQIGAFIEKEFGIVYERRSGLIALLHRLGLEYHKPKVIPRRLDEAKQRSQTPS
jgi:transposase